MLMDHGFCSGVSPVIEELIHDMRPISPNWYSIPVDMWTHIILVMAQPFDTGFVMMASRLAVPTIATQTRRLKQSSTNNGMLLFPRIPMR